MDGLILDSGLWGCGEKGSKQPPRFFLLCVYKKRASRCILGESADSHSFFSNFVPFSLLFCFLSRVSMLLVMCWVSHSWMFCISRLVNVDLLPVRFLFSCFV